MSPGTSASGGQRGGGGHHSGGDHRGPTVYKPPATVTVEGPHRGDGIGSQTFDINKRTIQKRHDYNRGAYQRAHPFLSKIRSGLGSLGRGIGHVARNFNPISFAFDNPLMKLLMSGYGRGNIRDLFQRNNQNINWNDPDEEEDIAWENINYNPNAKTRLEQLGIMNRDILPEDKSYESYFDDRNLMADLSKVQQGILDRPDVDFSYGENPTQTIENLLNPGSGFRGHDINEAPATKEDIENWYKGTYKPTMVG